MGRHRIVIVMIQQVPKISIARPASGGCGRGRESNFALQVVPCRERPTHRPTLDLKTWIPQSAALSAHSMHSTQIKLGAELLRDAKLSQKVVMTGFCGKRLFLHPSNRETQTSEQERGRMKCRGRRRGSSFAHSVELIKRERHFFRGIALFADSVRELHV